MRLSPVGSIREPGKLLTCTPTFTLSSSFLLFHSIAPFPRVPPVPQAIPSVWTFLCCLRTSPSNHRNIPPFSFHCGFMSDVLRRLKTAVLFLRVLVPTPTANSLPPSLPPSLSPLRRAPPAPWLRVSSVPRVTLQGSSPLPTWWTSGSGSSSTGTTQPMRGSISEWSPLECGSMQDSCSRRGVCGCLSSEESSPPQRVLSFPLHSCLVSSPHFVTPPFRPAGRWCPWDRSLTASGAATTSSV